jgi:hypothetical protein
MILVYCAIVCGRSMGDAAMTVSFYTYLLILWGKKGGLTDESCELSRASSRTYTLVSVDCAKGGGELGA